MTSSKQQKIASFNPNDLGDASNQIFGLPFTEDEADVVIIPAPWDVTVSYGAGTSNGPEAILAASYQVDLFDADLEDAWKHGIAMQELSLEWRERALTLREKAERYIAFLEAGGSVSEDSAMQLVLQEINSTTAEFREWISSSASKLLKAGKLVGLVGGDHSTPLGFFDALSKVHQSFGILQIDAHCDLREAYEGFLHSHASIMWNALQLPAVSKLVQVGIRDYSEGEVSVIKSSAGRVTTFFDRDLKRRSYDGEKWKDLCAEIVKALPEKVYISFDIDGLDPKLCPNTGTPVPGGLEFEQAVYLVRAVVDSGRTIIGFDLNEVSPGESEWDANVGARLLYKLCNLMLRSNKK